jgi:hypothetical protein
MHENSSKPEEQLPFVIVFCFDGQDANYQKRQLRSMGGRDGIYQGIRYHFVSTSRNRMIDGLWANAFRCTDKFISFATFKQIQMARYIETISSGSRDDFKGEALYNRVEVAL